MTVAVAGGGVACAALALASILAVSFAIATASSAAITLQEQGRKHFSPASRQPLHFREHQHAPQEEVKEVDVDGLGARRRRAEDLLRLHAARGPPKEGLLADKTEARAGNRLFSRASGTLQDFLFNPWEEAKMAFSAGAHDSRVFMGPHGFCSFTNALVSPTRTILIVHNPELRAALSLAFDNNCHLPLFQSGDAARSDDPILSAIALERGRFSTLQQQGKAEYTMLVDLQAIAKACKRCFHRNRLPAFIAPESIPTTVKSLRGGHYLGFEQYHVGHHWGHFVEQMGMTFAYLSTFDSMEFGAYDGVLIMKTASFQGPEIDFAEIGLAPLSSSSPNALDNVLFLPQKKFSVNAYTDKDPNGADQNHQKQNNPSTSEELWTSYVRVPRISISMSTTLVAASRQEAHTLRAAANAYFGWDVGVGCPPPRVLFVQREGSYGRNIGNLLDLGRIIKELTGIHPETYTVSDLDTLRDQALAFRSYGIIISPHSSQLVSMVYAHSNASLIELAPVVFNLDFAHMAALYGLDYRIVTGIGTNLPQPPSPLIATSATRQQKCSGDLSCLLGTSWCADYMWGGSQFYHNRDVRKECIQYKKRLKGVSEFNVVLSSFIIAVAETVGRLNRLPQCLARGGWV